MKKVITYGTFDLMHEGHLNLLRRAKALGDFLIVGVTTDAFDMERGKMNTCDDVITRLEAVKATGLADKIILEEYKGQKIDDIQKYGVDIFTVGSDWEGKFDYLKEFCEVVYLPRTEGISSTSLRERRPCVRFGIIGTGSIASRFVPESKFVNSNTVSAVYNPSKADAEAFAEKFSIPVAASSPEEIYDNCDAVYIASPHYTHYDYAKNALNSGKHVLCETPLVLKSSQAAELISIAKSNNKILALAHKTAYCPAFIHLMLMLKAGIIGDIVEVNASVSTLMPENSPKLNGSAFGGSMNENACFPLLPIVVLLGTDWRNINFYSRMKNGVDIFTKAVFRFDNAVASFQVGLGVKTEGNMVVSGTKGYAYVPAPWWKTDYFEIRYEDQNLNRKYFYPFEGEGLRYEIKNFVGRLLSGEGYYSRISPRELIAMSEVQERYLQGVNLYKI